MSRIYLATEAKSGATVRYIRAKTLAGAIRALAAEEFVVKPATTDEIYSASKAGTFDVLDAVDAE
jgi:hypothetical protein